MTTFFVPQQYPSHEAIMTAFVFCAVSRDSVDNQDVFGYVGDVIYFCSYEDDEDGFYAVPVDPYSVQKVKAS